MCPACIANTVAMVAGAGSTGGLLAVCIVKFKRVFKSRLSVSDRRNKRADTKGIEGRRKGQVDMNRMNPCPIVWQQEQEAACQQSRIGAE
jgi:hypothetical protein